MRLIRTSAYLCFYNLMETASAYLFVYGTLLLPTNQFGRYLNVHCKPVASAKFKGRLYDIGEYPGALADDSANTYVYGSIYLMDDASTVLQVLDDYEGIGPNDPLPHEYIRTLLNVETESGSVNCWIYFYALPVDQHHQIPGGDYIQYLSNQSA
ncbi:gamma-glutamylcyclotransferase [Mucilaginibacter celer]|uniref:Gamma-glutamylcyclotransferase n=2 Tax=Mucilaginibacter celer TaxID=2305508 RepID=A0A494VTD7_9SPHI|nr:gamma-glutamylcyclotransferase [Mucilaginibacter celer]